MTQVLRRVNWTSNLQRGERHVKKGGRATQPGLPQTHLRRRRQTKAKTCALRWHRQVVVLVWLPLKPLKRPFPGSDSVRLPCEAKSGTPLGSTIVQHHAWYTVATGPTPPVAEEEKAV